MKKILIFVLFGVLLVMMAGCAPGSDAPDSTIQLNAPGPNPQVNKPDENGRVAGVVLGIWHGIIAPVSLVVSFSNEDVQMYEVHNNGPLYNLGFLFGDVLLVAVLGLLGGRRR